MYTRDELIEKLGLKPCIYPPVPEDFFIQPGESTRHQQEAQKADKEKLDALVAQHGGYKKLYGKSIERLPRTPESCFSR